MKTLKTTKLVMIALLLTMITACGNQSASNAEETARTFVQAMISADASTLDNINKSDPLMGMPTNALLSMDAPAFSGYKPEDFSYAVDDQSGRVRIVSKDQKIDKSIQVKKIGDAYYFVGYSSPY